MTTPSPQQRLLQSRQEYIEALDEIFLRARHSLRIFDNTLEWSGYENLARHEALNGFLSSSRHNRLMLVVHNADFLVRHCPRLMELYRRYTHVFEIRQTLNEAKHVYDPFVIADGKHYVHRFHHAHDRGEIVFDDVEYSGLLLRRFEEIWQASEANVAATTLGL